MFAVENSEPRRDDPDDPGRAGCRSDLATPAVVRTMRLTLAAGLLAMLLLLLF